MKGWNKIYWASTEKRKAGVAILISDRVKVKNRSDQKTQGRKLHLDKRQYRQ